MKSKLPMRMKRHTGSLCRYYPFPNWRKRTLTPKLLFWIYSVVVSPRNRVVRLNRIPWPFRLVTVLCRDLSVPLPFRLVTVLSWTVSSLNRFVLKDSGLMWCLSQILIISDRKFALKSRLTGSLQITMDVIKQNANNFKVLHPALLVIKLSAGSSKFCITQRYSFQRAHLLPTLRAQTGRKRFFSFHKQT